MHIPVLLDACLDLLAVRPGGVWIDCTANGGGHTRAILEATAPDGRVLAIDRDIDLVKKLRDDFRAEIAAGRLAVECDSFAHLPAAISRGRFPSADGILFDLGLSSYHFDQSARGFSFQNAEALDMRFGVTEENTPTASELLATASVDELTGWFRTYGEERFASRIARTIVARRTTAPLRTTDQLLEAVSVSLPGQLRWRLRSHAARVFQALRIAVNRELEAIERVLPLAFAALAPGGRLVVISFHSLEDRLVKHYFRARTQEGVARLLTKKPILPSEAEIAANSRAASAKLRGLERLA